jgi:hypothetical protein
MPETVDDLYKIAKAFTEQDPDQNGKDDTFGLADRNDLTFGALKPWLRTLARRTNGERTKTEISSPILSMRPIKTQWHT